MRKPFSTRLLKLILMIFIFCMTVPLFTACSGSNADINAMCLNMKVETQGNPAEPIYTWANRKPGIVAALKKYKVDILGTQELTMWQHEEIMNDLGDKWTTIGRPRSGTSGEGNYILYRNDILECIEWETIWLSQTPNVAGSTSWGTAASRMLTFGKFKVKKSGKEFYFFNTHLDHISALAREEGVKLIITYLDKYSDYPQILTGDFNTYITNDALLPLVEKEGFSDSFSPFSEKFEVNNKTTHGFNGGTEGMAIDFIFYSTGNLELVSTDIIYDKHEDRYWLSDHYPVYSKFNFS